LSCEKIVSKKQKLELTWIVENSRAISKIRLLALEAVYVSKARLVQKALSRS